MMQLIVKPDGGAHCIYGEDIALANIGQLSISRASHVEPTQCGRWMADLTPVDGPSLGPFQNRTEALSAEVQWLRDHWFEQV